MEYLSYSIFNLILSPGLDPCSPNPCGVNSVCQDNNGVINAAGNAFTCNCNQGWRGTLCNERKSMSFEFSLNEFSEFSDKNNLYLKVLFQYTSCVQNQDDTKAPEGHK